MARHVDPDDRSFRASLLRAAAGGLAALVISFGVTGLLSSLGRDDGTDGPAMVAQPTEVVPTSSPEPVAERETPPPGRGRPKPTDAPTPQETTEPDPQETTERKRVDVTVQVLDAVGTGTQAQKAADVLRKLGYDVVVVNPTPQRVEQTTILATDGHTAEAKALRDEDPRFAVVKKNTVFAESVDLHVLVGPDFAP